MSFCKRQKQIKIPDSPDEAFKKALKTAFNIVGYKNNTEYDLRHKLLERGYFSETVEDVMQYMKQHGFIDDRRMLFAEIRTLALTKLYGKARIKQELLIKHFDRTLISELDWDCDEIGDIDFGQICLKLVKKRGGQKDQKTYAFLKRYGHTPSNIKKAYDDLKEEE